MKECLHLPLEAIGVKSEFGFDTAATKSRSVAKRMFELLTPIASNGRQSFFHLVKSPRPSKPCPREAGTCEGSKVGRV